MRIPRLRSLLPELGLGFLLLYFAARELGTFPASWGDEGLFIVVAKMVAAGEGYATPLLEGKWLYPYFLNVGPTLVYPVALSIKLFGLSLEAARAPMVLWLFACAWLFYAFTKKIFHRTDALWATLLLVTFSAYVNTGKPVLGEIPAVAFLLGGLLLLPHPRRWTRTVGSGLLFGLAFLTKVTFGLILPALGVAWLAALWKRDWKEARDLTIVGALTLLTFIPWRVVEMLNTIDGKGLTEQLVNSLAGSGGSQFLYVLRFSPHLLLRLPYLAFGVFFVLGAIGWWRARKRLDSTLWIVTGALVALFALYFLNGFGWYRFLLPAHLLLLPFVPAGAFSLLGKKSAMLTLTVIAVVQAYWQWDHRGSSPSLEGPLAVDYILREYADKEFITALPEIFAQLPLNPRWRFIIPNITFVLPKEFSSVSGDDCKIPILRKLGYEEQMEYDPAQLETAAYRYVFVRDYPCPYVAQ